MFRNLFVEGTALAVAHGQHKWQLHQGDAVAAHGLVHEVVETNSVTPSSRDSHQVAPEQVAPAGSTPEVGSSGSATSGWCRHARRQLQALADARATSWKA